MNQYGKNSYWAAVRDYPPRIPGGLQKDHIHRPDEYHYMFVLEGSGRIRINDHDFILAPSFLYLTAPEIRHSFGANSVTLITIELKFTLSDSLLQEKASRLPPVVEDTTGELRQLLERIVHETEYPRPYQQELMDTRLRELIYLLLRIVQGDSCEVTPAEAIMQPVLHYCQQNLYKNITLEDLAEVAKLEKTYFSKKFKKISGYSPMAYLRFLRIEKAKELLRYSDLTVSQVAEALSFQSLQHFSKTFRQSEGCSPTAYKSDRSEDANK